VVKIIKYLLRRPVDRLIDNLFPEEFPGNFLNQFDTEGIMGANALYLLQFFKWSFKYPSQSLESWKPPMPDFINLSRSLFLCPSKLSPAGIYIFPPQTVNASILILINTGNQTVKCA